MNPKIVVGWVATVLTLAVTVASIVAVVAEWTVHVDVEVLDGIAAFVIPLLVGIVTKFVAPSMLRSALLAVFAVAAVAVTNAIAAGGDLDVDSLFVQAVVVFAGAFGIHKGLLENVGVAPAVRVATGSIGVGKGRTLPPEWREKALRAHDDGEGTAAPAALQEITVADEVAPFADE